MGGSSVARELVAAVRSDFPDSDAGTRPVHAIGIAATGQFTASSVASSWCTAAHFQGQPTPVTVRFSNGSGSPVERDGWSDVRGMATRFHLPDGSAADLVAMTLREFFTATVDDFLAFSTASRMTPVAWESPWNKLLDVLQLKRPLPNPPQGQTESGAAGSLAYANHHRPSQLAVFEAGTIGAPVSYARVMFHAVHTFIVTAPDGSRRHVRFHWQPAAGVKLTDPTAPPVDQYLHDELRARLSRWPVEFLLMMTLGEAGDVFDDPTRAWPSTRTRVVMGTLRLTAVAEDQDANCEKLGFNPCRVTPGIDLSNDPILACRREAYEVSQDMRGATPCPFSQG